MKQIFKRTTAIVLLLSMLLSAAACSENSENVDETQADAADPAATETEFQLVEEDGTTHYADLIEAVDYEGWTMHIANDGLSSDYFSAFTVEELTGDDFNDAIFNRNERIMDKFNIKITETYDGSVSALKNDVTAGTGEVAFGQVLFRSCMGLILQDYIRPMSSLPGIDLTKPYWDKGSVETLTFNGNYYFAHGDLGWDHYEGMAVLFYNGELLTDNNITETPYDLYMDDRWTLDNMHEMMNIVSRDTNGDGQMDIKYDVFGFTGRDFEFLPSLHSSNTQLVTYDKDAEDFVLNYTDETVMAVGDKLNAMLNDANISHPAWDSESRNVFKEGRVLFYSRLLGDFRNLRDKEDDYGIVSFPTLNENEPGRVYIQNCFTNLVPVSCEDPARLGTLIEAMSADTHDNVLNVYINKAVIGKGVRDEQSAELMRIMMTRRSYDLCYAFGLNSVISNFGAALKKGQYSSAASRLKNVFKKDMGKNIEKLTEEWVYD